MRTLSRSVPAPADLGVDVLGVPEGSALELDLRLESVVEGILVSGTVTGTVAGECVRCLDPVSQHLTVDVQELWTRGEPADAEDELPRLDGDLLDLEPVLRDAVVLALPLQPLCRDDCPGLCSECGAHLADDPGHGHGVADPRWAALQQLAERTDQA